MKYELFGAQGLIYYRENDEILLAKRKFDSKWVIPGGAIEERETPERATIREVKEETGIDVKIVGLIGVYKRPDKITFGKKGDITHLFLCEQIGGKFMQNDEVSKIKRFKIDNLPINLLLHHRKRIADAEAYIEKYVRAQ